MTKWFIYACTELSNYLGKGQNGTISCLAISHSILTCRDEFPDYWVLLHCQETLLKLAHSNWTDPCIVAADLMLLPTNLLKKPIDNIRAYYQNSWDLYWFSMNIVLVNNFQHKTFYSPTNFQSAVFVLLLKTVHESCILKECFICFQKWKGHVDYYILWFVKLCWCG